MLQHTVSTEIQTGHCTAGRQHGNHHLRILHGMGRVPPHLAALLYRMLYQGSGQIVDAHAVAGLYQIGRHRAAHIADSK